MSAAPAFSVDITRGEASGPETVRIAASGELDGASAPVLLQAFQESLSTDQLQRLTLDLAGLEFIDSAGLRALIALQQEAEQRGLALVVVPAPEAVTHLLQVAGVADRFRLVVDGPTRRAELDFLERTDTEYSPDVMAPARARAAVREVLGDALERPTLSTVVLMTSELVTNAVRHSSASEESSLVGMRVVVFPEWIRVEVDDPGPGFDPAMHPVELTPVSGPDQGGRGLFVVDRSAQRWGARQLENDRGRRFSVWFEVDSR